MTMINTSKPITVNTQNYTINAFFHLSYTWIVITLAPNSNLMLYIKQEVKKKSWPQLAGRWHFTTKGGLNVSNQQLIFNMNECTSTVPVRAVHERAQTYPVRGKIKFRSKKRQCTLLIIGCKYDPSYADLQHVAKNDKAIWFDSWGLQENTKYGVVFLVTSFFFFLHELQFAWKLELVANKLKFFGKA